MLHFNIINKVRLATLCCATAAAFSSCSLINDDLEPCPARLQLRFIYDNNLLETDSFASQVTSVHVWAFDHTGACVWSGSDSGQTLRQPGYVMVTPLEAGTYDFVVWGGLEDNPDFRLGSYKPSSRQDLDVMLKTIEEDGLDVSRSHLKKLFHGMLDNVSYTADTSRPSIQTATISLTKDTNDISVMLMDMNNNPLDVDDFTVNISYADSHLLWNNLPAPDSPVATYRPWAFLYGETTVTPLSRADEAERSAILYDLSTSRLMADGEAWLDVVRKSDNHTIIHLPLIKYLLYAKGDRYDQFTDQQYLDRQNDYSVLFFLDDNNDWYTAGGIFINGWAVVPPQEGGL